MSDSKKPTLSEIRVLCEELQHGAWLERQSAKHMLCARGAKFAPYLLDLVERMGKELERFIGAKEFPCDFCIVTCGIDGSVTHDKDCPIHEARALLEEAKK